ncbi:MAG: LamG domain-containing protein [Gammaproteobacteria bacterium]|nr:MAG: LamG domain-containing protein [Gammaproteobacteria bacterium]
MNSALLFKIFKHLSASFLAIVTVLLSGCGGTEVQSFPGKQVQSDGGTIVAYSGPAPKTADIQAFKVNLWDQLAGANRCGNCHDVQGPGTPAFVRKDDINLAYSLANGLIDSRQPANSRLVNKVGGGHHCWLTQNSACAALLTTYIDKWVKSSISSLQGTEIKLKAPVLKDPGSRKNFPNFSQLSTAQGNAFSALHTTLKTHCGKCHVSDSKTAQSPYFASTDPQTAYQEIQQKLNLDNPSQSRVVVRLRDEFHNCWSDCAANATTLDTQISAFASIVPLTQVDPALITSKALTLFDGTIASNGSRIDNNAIALYQFKTGQGTVAFDTSGIQPDLHLNMNGSVSWVSGWGVALNGGRLQGSTQASKKLHDMIQATGEYSIEAWVIPANVTQEGPATIVSYSAGSTQRNFGLGQTLYNYEFLQRSRFSDIAGIPSLATADADRRLQATLQHVVATYSPSEGRKLFVNGSYTGDADPATGTGLSGWDDTFALVLGDEPTQDKPWKGQIRLLAIHNRALTPQQVMQNFKAGVGERYFLLFSIETLTQIPQSYIVFEVSQFDAHSYLFKTPRFISLDPTFKPANTDIDGIWLGMNGKIVNVGQAFTHIKSTISSTQYSAKNGQLLSSLGTVIALENGPDRDEFFLSFNRIGNLSHTPSEPPLPRAPTPSDLPASADIGLHVFDEINASLSEMTGVPVSQTQVSALYQAVKQQMPAKEEIGGFSSSQQMGISQLAIEYCGALMNDQGTVTADQYFPNFPLADSTIETAAIAFNTAIKRQAVFDPLIQHAFPHDPQNTGSLTTQPAVAAVRNELDGLVTKLTGCATAVPATCNTTARTRDVVKASCAAVMGSAVMLIQ